MSRIIKHDNYRVIVNPRRLGDFGYASISDAMVCADEAERLKMYKDLCDEIVADIKRHVSGVGYVGVECDSEYVCGYCGASWTEDDDKYNGGCCAKDEIDAQD